MNVVKLREVGRAGLHAASLLFTAWALVATSAPDPTPVPSVECYGGVAPNASVQIALAATSGDAGAPGESDAGAPGESDAGAPGESDAGSEASTEIDAGADTLPEAGVDAAAPLGPAPVCESTSITSSPCVSSCNGIDGLAPGSSLVLDVAYAPIQEFQLACGFYQTNGVHGVAGVTLGTQTLSYLDQAAFTVATGTFASSEFTSCSGQWALTFEPVTPAVPDAGLVPLDASAGWRVIRTISFPQAQFCGGTFPVRGLLNCTDTFAVSAIGVTATGGDQ